jgi:ABC-type microcin C transport system permease subunit YejB
MSAETFHEEPRVLDTLVSFDEDRATGELIIKREQEIDDAWLSEVRKQKIDSANQKAGDFYHVASIPVEVVDELYRLYGFDVMTAPVRETLKMLQRYALDDFILTNKKI